MQKVPGSHIIQYPHQKVKFLDAGQFDVDFGKRWFRFNQFPFATFLNLFDIMRSQLERIPSYIIPQGQSYFFEAGYMPMVDDAHEILSRSACNYIHTVANVICDNMKPLVFGQMRGKYIYQAVAM